MTVTDTTATAGPSTGPATRSSARVRNKSARAIENEHTESLLKAAREKRVEREKSVDKKEEGDKDGGEEGEKGEDKADGGEEGGEEDAAQEGPEEGGKLEPGPEEDAKAKASTTKGKKRARAPPKKRKSKYCLCHETRDGPMIECGECGDWFHFNCINLPEAEAERIRAYPDWSMLEQQNP